MKKCDRGFDGWAEGILLELDEGKQRLEIAAGLQRLLVTHDRKTMPKAVGAFASRSQSFGVLVVPQKIEFEDRD
jgi:hypothetical protein